MDRVVISQSNTVSGIQPRCWIQLKVCVSSSGFRTSDIVEMKRMRVEVLAKRSKMKCQLSR